MTSNSQITNSMPGRNLRAWVYLACAALLWCVTATTAEAAVLTAASGSSLAASAAGDDADDLGLLRNSLPQGIRAVDETGMGTPPTTSMATNILVFAWNSLEQSTCLAAELSGLCYVERDLFIPAAPLSGLLRPPILSL